MLNMFGCSAKDKEIELLKLQIKNWHDAYMILNSDFVNKNKIMSDLRDKIRRIHKHMETVKDMQPGFSGHNWRKEIADYQQVLQNIRDVLRMY